MRALIPTGRTGALVELGTASEPVPGPGEALVAVEAFSLNRPDFLYLAAGQGAYRPGIDAVGTVERAAADGSGPKAGQRVVLHLPGGGAAAERVAVPPGRLAVVPDGLETTVAAALPLAGMVALRLLRAAGDVRGRRLLATGVTGGVGLFLVQLAVAAGASVTAVARPDDPWQHLIEAGAKVIHTVEEAATGAYDVVLESVGGRTGSQAALKLRTGGLFLWFGQAGAEPIELDFFRLFEGGQGLTLRHFVHTEGGPDDSRDMAELLRLASSGQLRVELGHRGDWADTAAVLEKLARGRLKGKAVLTISA
ncbi:zinc-binding dehydrogenase [Planomonospora venezuelensis]|uniref:NADPH:quinone reductase-like Zn-dependent oxidoreductase n=1 Tax=Planomonospora venezuelensis TaxID=1999 RepID=A0A841DBE6_PLAVE|nr:zinc-binding dehydrogenase [Planomonospora venezuelensis]MBB5966077.1 NADPH:quinone reductase-like Zn-dependent oxidoreductase [Planomonospora venezuelensis]GIN03610.1 oxidoreductase [Planomonospora venezuelensis]